MYIALLKIRQIKNMYAERILDNIQTQYFSKTK